MFFYNENIPCVNDYVVVKVKEIKEFGYICELIEYDNAIAYLNIVDVTTEKIKRFNDLKKYLRPNGIEVLEIKEIDDIGNINLNRKYLDEILVKEKMNKFVLYEKIHNYLFNNKKVMDHEKELIMNELKYRNIDFEDFLNKHAILCNLKLKSVNIDEKDNFTFTFKNYDNVYSLKDNFIEIKKKFDIKDISIINSKNGIFNIKTNNKYSNSYFEEIENNIKSIDYSNCITPKVEKVEQDIDVQPLLNIGVIGHVSHGKTTLIQRLTNVDTKKYKKELDTNKTLKLGYTNAYVTRCVCFEDVVYINKKCCNIKGNCDTKLVSIVDCPGHHILMNTMLCGTSIMDTSIIMIASNEICPQPQTIDHVMAVTINNGESNYFENSLVVLNKCDLVTKTEAEKRYNEVKEFVKGSLIEKCNIVPTSAQKNINLNKISEWMYEYVCKKQQTIIENDKKSKALIVRTFDINKPGTFIENISGLVIGSSILEGEIKVGDEIIILPEGIKTKVYELYTDKIRLNRAKKGGLIGVKTDISPKYSEIFIGSFFIKAEDYKEEYLKSDNIEYEFSYLLRKDVITKKIFKEEEYIDINIQGKYIKNCKIIKIDKNEKKIKIVIPYKTYIIDDIKISFLKNNNLIGYGEIIKNKDYEKNKINMELQINFTDSLENFYKQYKIFEKQNMKNIIKLPNPIIKFSNHVTTFYNFIEISNMIDSNYSNLGNYIMNELGLKSMSINETQLILKGKADENKVENILTKYLLENKLCKNCYSYDTFINKIQNCKVVVCRNCDYTVKK